MVYATDLCKSLAISQHMSGHYGASKTVTIQYNTQYNIIALAYSIGLRIYR